MALCVQSADHIQTKFYFGSKYIYYEHFLKATPISAKKYLKISIFNFLEIIGINDFDNDCVKNRSIDSSTVKNLSN